jgi:hypothetical protein
MEVNHIMFLPLLSVTICTCMMHIHILKLNYTTNHVPVLSEFKSQTGLPIVGMSNGKFGGILYQIILIRRAQLGTSTIKHFSAFEITCIQ